MPHDDAAALERKLRHKFKKNGLLAEALTHKSHAVEHGSRVFNERLEFLGDSILNAVVAHYFFKKHPNVDEGRLSKIKSQMVARPTLVEWAKELQLGRFILMSGGEESTGGRERDSLLANAFEALVGALYLDGGFLAAQRLIVRHLARRKRFVENDYKSKLQEVVQKDFKIPPVYTVVDETGPDHAKTFSIEVRIRRRLLGRGEGHSKKEAEQGAAFAALKSLRARRQDRETKRKGTSKNTEKTA